MILIKNAKILTMAGKDYDNADILIENKKIKKVAQNIDAEGDVIKIDCTGKYVMPGMVDAHCHIGMWEDAIGFEGADGNEGTDPVTPHLRAIDGVNPIDRCFEEARENGVTTVVTGPGSANVIGGQFAALKTVGKSVEDMVIKEPVALKVAFGENPKSVYSKQKKAPSTRMATAAILRETLIKAMEYKGKIESSKRDGDKKPERDLKLEVLVKVLNGEIPLKAHAHRADDILTAIRIAREFNVNITIDHCTEGHKIVDYLIEADVPVIVGPTLSERSKYELKELNFKTPGILSKAGLDVALMTDHPVIPIQYLPVCAALAVREGMDEQQALKAITINPAKIIGLDDRIGSIEPGKDADIVVLDGHPLEFITKTYMVMINGDIVFRR
ncbi:MAG: amidohydrolase [Clostridia bacterium]|nr:amidohydrolase [Clostridia bacterium]